MSRLVRLVLAGVLALLAAAPEASGTSLSREIQASFGLEGRIWPGWIPLTLTLTPGPSPDPRTHILEVSTEAGTGLGSIRAPILLPSSGNRIQRLLIPCPEYGAPTLLLDGKEIFLDFPKKAARLGSSASLALVLGPTRIGYNFLADGPSDDVLQVDQVISPRFEELPESVFGYGPTTLILLKATPGAALSPAQRDALLTWVLSGGTLILSLGDRAGSIKEDPFLREISPVTPSGRTVQVPYGEVAPELGIREPLNGALTVYLMEEQSGSRPASPGTRVPLVARRSRGQGSVAFLAFDEGDPLLAKHPDALRPYLMKLVSLLRHPHPPLSPLSGTRLDSTVFERVVKGEDSPSRRFFPPLLIVLGFLLYALSEHTVPASLRARMLRVPRILALSLVPVLLLGLLTPGPPDVRIHSLLLVTPDGAMASGCSLCHLRNPSRESPDVRLVDRQWIPLTVGDLPRGLPTQTIAYPGEFVLDQGETWTLLPTRFLSPPLGRTLVFTGLHRPRGPLRWEVACRGRRVEGVLDNRTGLTLSSPILLLGRDGLSLPDIPPGRFDLRSLTLRPLMDLPLVDPLYEPVLASLTPESDPKAKAAPRVFRLICRSDLVFPPRESFAPSLRVDATNVLVFRSQVLPEEPRAGTGR